VRRLDFATGADQAPAQLLWSVIGCGAFVITLILVRDHRVLDRYRYTWAVGGLALLLLPLAPGIGREINQARLWIRMGPVQFQPAEAAKVALVIFFASYFTAKRELLSTASRKIGPFRLPAAKHFGPVLFAWAISLAVLIFEKDLGMSVLFFAMFVGLLYVATARAIYLLAGTAMFATSTYAAYLRIAHVRVRVAIWLHLWDYVGDRGYQLAQSLFALGTGGIAGTGLAQGRPDFIPFASTDFVFSAIGEELGLLGTVAVLLCFLMLAGRGFRIALSAGDGFGKLLACGLTFILAVQTFVIIGGATRLIPLTGITLPFVSYGGSSLLANYVLIALLMRVSAGPAPERAKAPVAGDLP
jgi:cell division protein FtsW (lipid II flippase)